MTRAGHRYYVAPRHVAGTRCTGVQIHSRCAEHIDKVYHAARLSKVTLKATQGTQDNDVAIVLISLHVPSDIGHTHTQEDLGQLLRTLEQAMPRKRSMTVLGGDLNTMLCDQMPNDKVTRRRNSTFHDMLLHTMRGVEIRLFLQQVVGRGHHRRLRQHAHRRPEEDRRRTTGRGEYDDKGTKNDSEPGRRGRRPRRPHGPRRWEHDEMRRQRTPTTSGAMAKEKTTMLQERLRRHTDEQRWTTEYTKVDDATKTTAWMQQRDAGTTATKQTTNDQPHATTTSTPRL